MQLDNCDDCSDADEPNTAMAQQFVTGTDCKVGEDQPNTAMAQQLVTCTDCKVFEEQPSTAMTPQLVTCVDCGVEVDKADAQLVTHGTTSLKGNTSADMFRCKKCNRTRSRLTTVFKHRSDLKEPYAGLAPVEKKEFIMHAQDLIRSELAKSLTTKLSDVQTKLRGKSQTCGGEYHPLSFFQKKYEGRPDLLKNVLENAPQMEHPESKQKMWRDTRVSLMERLEQVSKVELTMTCHHEGKI